MAILKNISEIPVPKWANVACNGRVSYWYTDNEGKRHNIVVGKFFKDTQKMLPNENFKKYFPNEFEDYYGEGSSMSAKFSAGFYAVTLYLAAECGLYQCLQKTFGAQNSNAIMDYALFTITKQSSAAYRISDYFNSSLGFSHNSISDSFISNFFCNDLSESEIHQFRINWLKTCKETFDVNEVWISIDGSNHDCSMVGSALAEHGKSKSGNSKNIIGQIWAVDAKTGLPVTWFVNSGSIPDCNAFEEIMSFLGEAKIAIKGVILDRGFATTAVIDLIEKYNYQWVIMLKSDCYAHETMLQKHGQSIRMKVEQRIASGGLYGQVDNVKIFKNREDRNRVGLFFHSKNAIDRAEHLSDKIDVEFKRLSDAIKDGKTPTVNKSLTKYFKIEYKGDKAVNVTCDKELWQKDFDEKGFFSIACSYDADIKELNCLYNFRDSSEKIFSALKSHLGFDTLRGHSDISVLGRIMTSFVASIVRRKLENVCSKVDVPTNLAIDALEKISISASTQGEYFANATRSNKAYKILKAIGITFQDFQHLAYEVNLTKDNVDLSDIRSMPCIDHLMRDVSPAKKQSSDINNETAQDSINPVKRGRGRPAGSKNKSTLERESLEKDLPPQPKAKAGRPKGSKNKKTLAREAEERLNNVIKVKRSPGRPKGSKNKATLAKEALAASSANAQTIVRGKGRPAGSKNKKTLAFEALMAKEKALEKRGPGRPKGSKNMATLINEAESARRAAEISALRSMKRADSQKQDLMLWLS